MFKHDTIIIEDNTEVLVQNSKDFIPVDKYLDRYLIRFVDYDEFIIIDRKLGIGLENGFFLEVDQIAMYNRNLIKNFVGESLQVKTSTVNTSDNKFYKPKTIDDKVYKIKFADSVIAFRY